MRRALILGAVVLSVLVVAMPPAQAARQTGKCRTLASDGTNGNVVCETVNWHRMAGVPGLSVDRIQTSINDNGDWSSPVAVDCSVLKITNANGVITWQKTGNDCDIPTAAGNHEYAPQQDMPQSPTASVRLTGNANISGAPDQDFTITVDLTQ